MNAACLRCNGQKGGSKEEKLFTRKGGRERTREGGMGGWIEGGRDGEERMKDRDKRRKMQESVMDAVFVKCSHHDKLHVTLQKFRKTWESPALYETAPLLLDACWSQPVQSRQDPQPP